MKLLELQSPIFDSPEAVVALIKQHCSQILDVYANTDERLLRGEMTMTESAFTSSIRQDRTPREMPKVAHELLHNSFIKCGLNATRKNSIFCSTSEQLAYSWGDAIYTIYPYDGWSGTVFETFKKGYAYNRLEQLADTAQYGLIDTILPDGQKADASERRQRTYEERMDFMVNGIKRLKPIIVSPNNLDEILDEKYEDILITGTNYIGVRALHSKRYASGVAAYSKRVNQLLKD